MYLKSPTYITILLHVLSTKTKLKREIIFINYQLLENEVFLRILAQYVFIEIQILRWIENKMPNQTMHHKKLRYMIVTNVIIFVFERFLSLFCWEGGALLSCKA